MGHYGFSSITTSLSTGFQVYLSKCQVLVCDCRLYNKTCFLLCSFLSVLERFRTILEFVLGP